MNTSNLNNTPKLNITLLGAVALLSTYSAVQAQTSVFIPEGWLYNTMYTGTAQGTSVNGGTTMVPADPGTNFQIQNKVASPQGGDFVAGHYQGTQNFVNYFNLIGFNINDFINSGGTACCLIEADTENDFGLRKGSPVAS